MPITRKYSALVKVRSKRRWVWMISPWQTSRAALPTLRQMSMLLKSVASVRAWENKRVAKQDGERVAPFGVGGGHHAAGVCAIDDVIMDQGGHVDEFEDDADFQVVVGDTARGSADENGEGGPDAFAGGVADVGDIWLDGGIEATDLFADGDFHALEFRADEFKGKKIAAGRCAVVVAMMTGRAQTSTIRRPRNPDIRGNPGGSIVESVFDAG